MEGQYYPDNPLSEDGRPQTMVIDRNSAKCLRCGDEIESTHRHDFCRCTCGDLFVDGGKDYIRRGFKSLATFEDTSESHLVSMSNAEIQQYREWGFF